MRNIINAQVFWYLLILWLASSLAVAKESKLRAYVEESEIKAGEAVILTVEYSGKTEDRPDFSVLSAFSKISEQQGQESTIINGNFSQKTTWTLELLPKSSEKFLTIPAIRLGTEETLPIKITQKESSALENKGKEVWLNVTTDRDRVYLHGQLIVHVEVKTSLSLRNGSLDQLELKDAIVEPLLEDSQSEVIENGIKYRVFRRSYAVFPSKLGQLDIPVLNFSAVAMSARENGWPFFSSGSRVQARSHEIKIKVLDVPESYPKDQPFLPIKNLVIIETIEDQAKFEVNQATARRFEIKADGALSTFLPQIKEPSQSNLQVYSEEGAKTQTPTEQGILSSHKVTHMYMPSKPGSLVVPEQVIYWWDTDKDELKTTVIRELAIEVGGKASAVPKNITKPEEKQVVPKESPKDKPINYWVIALISVLILLVLSGLYLNQKRKEKLHARDMSEKEQLKNMIKELVSSCEKGDLKLCYQRAQKLLAWPKLHALALVSDDLKLKVAELETELYRAGKTTSSVLLDIKRIVREIKFKKNNEILKSIYPN